MEENSEISGSASVTLLHNTKSSTEVISFVGFQERNSIMACQNDSSKFPVKKIIHSFRLDSLSAGWASILHLIHDPPSECTGLYFRSDLFAYVVLMLMFGKKSYTIHSPLKPVTFILFTHFSLRFIIKSS